MATGASNGSSRIINTRFHPLAFSTNHITAIIARRKVAGRKVAEMMTLPQMGFPSLMKFAPLTRSETTSKIKSTRSGWKLSSTTQRRQVWDSPSTRIFTRGRIWSCHVSLVGQAERRKKRRKQNLNLQAITAVAGLLQMINRDLCLSLILLAGWGQSSKMQN